MFAQIAGTHCCQPADGQRAGQIDRTLRVRHGGSCPRGDSAATYMGEITGELLVGADL